MTTSRHLEPLRAAVRKERAGAWLGAILFQAFAMVCVLPLSPRFCALIDMRDPGAGAWILGALGLGLALAGAHFARNALLARDVDRTPLLRKLLHDPEDVVWVHAGSGVDYRVGGSTVNRTRFVSILCESRENGSIEVAEADVEELLGALERHLPHARIGGFDADRLARYLEDPRSLRLEPREPPRGPSDGYREPARHPARRAGPPPPRVPYLLVALVAAALTLLAPVVFDVLGPAPALEDPWG